MSPENPTPLKSSIPGNMKIMAAALVASLAVNVYQFTGTAATPETTLPKNKTASQTFSYMPDTTATCTGTIDMTAAQAWIGKASGIKFNNKSIFICPDAVRAMLDQPDFDGIWIRRGQDDGNVIHDIAWTALGTPGTNPDVAYLLEWRSCVCVPCCGSDTSDFREYQ